MEQRRATDHLEYMPRILSEEEVDLYLKGDRREIDRLLLYSVNRVSAALIDHMRKEDEREDKSRLREAQIQNVGGFEAITERAKFVDTLILKNEKHIRMMEKVEGSSYLWAVIIFLGFLGVAVWEYVKDTIRKGPI